MKNVISATALAFLAGTFALPANAMTMDMKLPAACQASEHAMPMDQSKAMQGMPMKDFQKDFMAGMQAMDPAMMQGMMQDKADVAFICGMIAHHMGAVQMSQVELKYGKDEWARKLAQTIIGAQMKEIDDMTKWLEKSAK